MREQAAEKIPADGREYVAIIKRERIDPPLLLDQRLMQMPATRDDVRQSRAAHEGGEIAVAARNLLHRRANQDHVVGRRKADLRAERELALARAEFNFDHPQWQFQRLHAAANWNE